MAGSGVRSPYGRSVAEAAFARLLDASGDHWDELVLIGGLLPEMLVASDDEHQGTTDVDVLLDIGVVWDRDDRDFAWLERALGRAGFVPASSNTGWRWVGEREGDVVQIEFVVDVADSRDQEIALPGAAVLGAKNLDGPAPALRRSRVVRLAGRSARIASLGGYLAAKSAAVVARSYDKDLYDFAYVVVHSERTAPGQASRAVRDVLEPDRDRGALSELRAACGLYADRSSRGAVVYASTARAAGAVDDVETLALDAVAAMAVLWRELVDL